MNYDAVTRCLSDALLADVAAEPVRFQRACADELARRLNAKRRYLGMPHAERAELAGDGPHFSAGDASARMPAFDLDPGPAEHAKRDELVTRALGIGPGETLRIELDRSVADDAAAGWFEEPAEDEPAEDEPAKQARLAGEARTVLLGTLGASRELASDTARVEVTYQRPGDVEHSGHFIVRVATLESADLDEHPATIAERIVEQWAERNGPYDYFSVDDTTAA